MDHAKCSFYAQLTYTTHMILTLLELAPPHAVTNGPPLVKRGYKHTFLMLYGAIGVLLLYVTYCIYAFLK